MSFYFSKSKFIAACTRCNKYAWLDKYRKEEKAKPDEFVEGLFDNGHKVGALAKQRFKVDADVTILEESGAPNNSAMIVETKRLIDAGVKTIAEASFSFGVFFCSVDILEKNDDGTYNIYEVKSSKIESKKKKDYYKGVKEKYVLDAAYQQYVLENCGYKIDKVFVVLLAENYVRDKELDLKEYFKPCDVTDRTILLQEEVKDKLAELGGILSEKNELPTTFTKNCKGCDYFSYCAKVLPSPSPFDIFGLGFSKKCDYYYKGVSFFDVPGLKGLAKRQVDCFNGVDGTYINKPAVKSFLDKLEFPLYSLDFETYSAVVPEYEGIATYEQVSFQYSLQIVKDNSFDLSKVEECNFLDISGGDARSAIAKSLVDNIPKGACIVAYNKSVESGVIERLANHCPEYKAHLLSFKYLDPSELFRDGHYYLKAMGNKYSLKSVAPAICPEDKEMNYNNLEGNVKNGTQAMNAICKTKELSLEEIKKLEQDLKKYCALDTLAVVKIIKRLYEAMEC